MFSEKRDDGERGMPADPALPTRSNIICVLAYP